MHREPAIDAHLVCFTLTYAKRMRNSAAMSSRVHLPTIEPGHRPAVTRKAERRGVPGRPNGARCACGGSCPRCRGDGVAALAGAQGKDSAPLSSQPDPLTERFGRWVGYTTMGSIQFNPLMNPPQASKPFFRWNVDFQTSMEIGTVVQLIESTWWAENCDGTTFTGVDNNATYWESWHVEKNTVKDRDKLSGANDRWERNVCDVPTLGGPQCPIYQKPTHGVWAMAGTLYAYPGIDLGWSPGGHTMSGSRPSTTTPPTQDLGRPMARREIGGTWNSCNPANPTHTRL